ncbi:prepilin peptidase [Candidatus Uhrbacteria bacterium]|nr:prepilin peptidase [Candidatus Uhrbacteria bacterium]
MNAAIWRVATGRGIGGRSMCPHCHKTLRAFDLIPVVSFFILKGKCGNCHQSISWQYPLVELSTAVAFVFVGNQIAQGVSIAGGIAQAVILSLLIALFVMDFQYGVLPDLLTLPAIAIVVCSRLWLESPLSSVVIDMLWGATIGVAFFAVQWVVSHGRWIGDGDIRLGALMGVLLGVPGVLLALLISYILGAIVASVLLLGGGKTLKSAIPLGPFLIVGTLVVYYGQEAMLSFLGV